MLVSDESGTYIGLYLTDCIACRITRLRASCLPVPAPLSGHSCGLGLGQFPRCLSTQLRRPYERSTCVQSLMARFWVLLYLQRTLVCNPISLQMQKPPNSFGDLGLGEAASKRSALTKHSFTALQDHQKNSGVLKIVLSSDATQTGWIIHSLQLCQEVFFKYFDYL